MRRDRNWLKLKEKMGKILVLREYKEEKLCHKNTTSDWMLGETEWINLNILRFSLSLSKRSLISTSLVGIVTLGVDATKIGNFKATLKSFAKIF